VQKAHGAPGVKWRRLSWDLVALANDLVHGRLAVRDYVASFGGPKVAAIFAADDPLPGLLEVPLLVFILCARLARGDGV
jgi:predicted ATP-grasp superfamily ATP-dependent carboligase